MGFALVRDVPLSFDKALTMNRVEIDVARAQEQHAAYVAALAATGLEIVRLAADEDCPDCCFVEDIAVIVDGVALITRPGAPSRRAEVDAVAAALAARMPVRKMEAPATADGGDCLLAEEALFVGQSSRTNNFGTGWLETASGRVVIPVALPLGVLHLKSVCSPLTDDIVLVAEGTVRPDIFPRVILVPEEEARAANVVVVGTTVLVPPGCPRTTALIEGAGLAVVVVDTSELRKADAALTCLSVIGHE